MVGTNVNNENEVAKAIRDFVENAEKRAVAIEIVREIIHELSDTKSQPVDMVRWVPINMVDPNDYNPNSVASIEMKLLATSILHDGYTQPIVTMFDKERNRYVIVDGFHRYFTMKTNTEVWKTTGGRVPVVVIDKPLNDRMASTVRHNRARGKHSVSGMANIVFAMLDNGWGDAEICNELGMDAEELLRVKHISGFSKLFADAEYNLAWKTRSQIRIEIEDAKKGNHVEECATEVVNGE